MAYMYKIDNNFVSSALCPLEEVFSSSRIRVSSSALNIFLADNIALGLNIGSSRMAYKHNNILFKTAKISEQDKWNVTYVVRPSIDRGFVGWTGSFSPTASLYDLTGIDASSAGGNVEIFLDSADGYIDIAGDRKSIGWQNSDILVEGSVVSGSYTIDFSSGSITINTEKMAAMANGDFSSIEVVDLDALAETSDSYYTFVDFSEGVFKQELAVDDGSGPHFDEYSNRYTRIDDSAHPAFDVFVSGSAIWLPSKNPAYLKSDEFEFGFRLSDSSFVLFNTDKLEASFDTSTLYVESLIKCSERVFVGYARVYSSYVYLDYYYVKHDAADGECAALDDTVTLGRACRLKIYSSQIQMMNVDSSLETVELADGVVGNEAEIYSKIRFGVGSFHSDYKLYSYRDRRDYIEVIFNRESSSKYIKVRIDDEQTRYKATITVKSGTQQDVTTKYFYRYSSTPIWDLGNTATLNMHIKRAFDSVSDTAETLYTNGAITLGPESIKILTRALYVNILEQSVDYPQMHLTYDTLSVISTVDDDDNIKLMEIIYQPASGAIYGRFQDGSTYTVLSKDEMLGILNSVNERYTFDMTCNISKLTYEDLDGNQQEFSFSSSTMVVAEVENGVAGTFYRVYYKNVDSYGFVNAKTYSIQE